MTDSIMTEEIFTPEEQWEPKEGFVSIHQLSIDDLKTITLHLFQIIDNIDTASDMAKGDERAYRRIVEREQARRWEVADSDGYTLVWKRD